MELAVLGMDVQIIKDVATAGEARKAHKRKHDELGIKALIPHLTPVSSG